MKKLIALPLISLYFASCVNISQDEYNSQLAKIDSLQIELSLYKEKYGELPTLNKESGKFGIWNVNFYVDDFGEATKQGYVSTILSGSFSNSATTNSDLKVQFIIDKSSMRMQLYEYGRNHPIKGEGYLKFKARDKNGYVHDFETYNEDNGDNRVIAEFVVRELLLNGGEVKFVGISNKYNSPSEYNFSIQNTDFLKDALNFISE